MAKSSDYLLDNKWVYSILSKLVHFSDIFIIGFIVLFIIGAVSVTPNYFFNIYFATKIFFASYLLYRFNSYRVQPITLTELDRKIIFSAGIYIFIFSLIEFYDYLAVSDKKTSTSTTNKSSIEIVLDYLRSIVSPHTSPFINDIRPVNSNSAST
jgi:hypothetical protein